MVMMLMEERISEMIPPSGRGKPVFRVAHFLKPSFPNSQQLNNNNNINNTPPPISPTSKPISQIRKTLSTKVNFNGWKKPLKNWNTWIDKLLPKHQYTWKNSSVYDPIMASKFDITRCKDSIFSISEKWYPETNTFVFSWGEVTLTLEDVLFLGGFPVTGESILVQISSSNLKIIKRNLENVYLNISRSKSKKVSHQQWMDTWMKKGGDFEHEAFLTLWLSRYVLPAQARNIINKNVFEIAILLARGTRIALAPAVLASIYNDLRSLKEMISSLRELGDGDNVNIISLSSPLYLLQVWVWERFTTLSPKPNPLIDHGSPRLQRWNKVGILRNDDYDFDSAVGSFLWRPYTAPLNNWSASAVANIYVEEARMVSVTSSEESLDLQTYVRIVRNSKLVGLNCVEQYLPHRVSMQFGFDQDIPSAFQQVKDTSEMSWNDYNRRIGDVALYIPSRLFKSDVTTRYLQWWKESKVVKKENDNDNQVEQKKGSLKMSMLVPPGFSPKRKSLEASDSSEQHQPSSKRSRESPCRPVNVIGSSKSNAVSSGASQIKGVNDVDDEYDDDHLTLSGLFGVKDAEKAERRDTLSVNSWESPLSSSGDNAFNQEMTSKKDYAGNILQDKECKKEELIIIEEGNESKAGSQIRKSVTEECTREEEIIGEKRSDVKAGCQVKNTMSIDKNEDQTILNGTPDCPKSSDMDILDRIARLKKLMNWVIAERMSQA